MSRLMPTRDLPPLEPESDDEFLKTPAKLKFDDPAVNYSLTDIKQSSIFLPKRASELPPLELDSEEDDDDSDEDDERRNDRLNSPLLNDSFILTPSKNLEDIINTTLPKSNKNDNLSSEFEKMRIAHKENADINHPRQELFKLRDETNRKPLSNILFGADSSAAATDVDDHVLGIKLLQEPIEETKNLFSTPLTKLSDHIFISKNGMSTLAEEKTLIGAVKKDNSSVVAITGTPFNSGELNNFVTPQVKSFHAATTRRNRLSSSSKPQKSLTDLKDEFKKSQKVLFTTPMSMSRPPANTLANDSLTLGLHVPENNIEDVKNDRLSPSKELKMAKKSSEDLFSGFVKPASHKNIDTNSATVEGEIVVINGKDFILREKLGSGGSSKVYLAEQKNRENSICALKIVNLQGDKSIVEGYLNETKLLAKLQGNVNVVTLYEYEHIPQRSVLYMVMEKGDSDLQKILQSYKTDLPLHILINYWYQILQSVYCIHENGVIHSDLKPANFLMINGRLKLIDFGIASNIAFDSTSIIKFSQAGTFNYISPEALIDTSTGNSPTGKNQPKIKLSTKSDVWSLGCILYFFLYKKTPFGHIKNVYAKATAISSPSTIIDYPELPFYYPPMLLEMAQRCLQHNPKKRLSVSELLKYPFHMVAPIQNTK